MNNCVICGTEIGGLKKMYCSNTCKQTGHYYKVKNQPNTYHAQTLRSFSRKLDLIKLAGGKCQSCGYDKNMAALEFHHKDSNHKDGSLDSRSLANRSIKYIMEEFQKCDLLCANCHREVHHPELELNRIDGLITQVKEKSLIDTRNGKPKCLDCGCEINYTSKRCIDCNNKFKTKPNKPDINLLIKEVEEFSMTWCSKKYGVSRKTIGRWLNK